MKKRVLMLLACDPAFNNFGCAVLDQYGTVIDCGTIQTKKLLKTAADDVRRVSYITSQLAKSIRHYDIKGILSELPPGGGQSAAGVKGLAMAVGLLAALSTTLLIPIEWATPEEVKKALTGKKAASKEDMMDAACKKYNFPITKKKIYIKNTQKISRIDSIYHPLGKSLGKNQFEHIADAIGAFEALKHTNTARLFLHKSAT